MNLLQPSQYCLFETFRTAAQAGNQFLALPSKRERVKQFQNGRHHPSELLHYILTKGSPKVRRGKSLESCLCSCRHRALPTRHALSALSQMVAATSPFTLLCFSRSVPPSCLFSPLLLLSLRFLLSASSVSPPHTLALNAPPLEEVKYFCSLRPPHACLSACPFLLSF